MWDFFSLSTPLRLLYFWANRKNWINITNLRTNYNIFQWNVKLAGRKKTISFLVLDWRLKVSNSERKKGGSGKGGGEQKYRGNKLYGLWFIISF